MILCGLANLNLAARSEISQFDRIAFGKHFALHSPWSPPPALRLFICESNSPRFLWLWPNRHCRLFRAVAVNQETTGLLPSRLFCPSTLSAQWKGSEVNHFSRCLCFALCASLFSQRSRSLVCLVFHLLAFSVFLCVLCSLRYLVCFSALAFVCVLLVRLTTWSCLRSVVLLLFLLLFMVFLLRVVLCLFVSGLALLVFSLSRTASHRFGSLFICLISILCYFVCFRRCLSSLHGFPRVLCAASFFFFIGALYYRIVVAAL